MTSMPLEQASPASPLTARIPVPAWANHDQPAPWIPGDPGWAARHPSPQPGGPPWPAPEPRQPPSSPPPWMSRDVPWPSGDAAWPSGGPPWVVGTQPAPGAPAGTDQAGTDQGGTDQAGTDQAGTDQAGRDQPGPWRRLRLSPGHGTTVTVLVTAVVLLATGATAAWQAAELRSRLPATNTSLAMPRPAGPARPAARGHTPARAASTPATGSPATGSRTTGPPAGGAVRIAPAVAIQPHAQLVVTVLDSYFSAINRHDFQAYRSLFIPAIRVSLHNFGAGYQSTRDSRARLTGLAATGPLGLAATVTFVSHQTAADSPDHAACDRWHITVFLRHNGAGYRIRRHQPGFPAGYRPPLPVIHRARNRARAAGEGPPVQRPWIPRPASAARWASPSWCDLAMIRWRAATCCSNAWRPAVLRLAEVRGRLPTNLLRIST